MEELVKLVDPKLIANVLLAIAALQAVLAGLKKAVDLVKDRTATKVDDKIAGVLAMVLKPVDFLIKLLQGNLGK